MRFHRRGLAIAMLAWFICGLAAADEPEQEDIGELIKRGIALHDQQLYADAIAQYERALELDSDNAYAGYEMAFAYQASGNLPACIETASESLERGDASGANDIYLRGLYIILASCHSASGESDQALQIFRDGIQRYPDNYGLHLNIAITLISIDDLDTAQDHLVTAMTLEPLQSSPYLLLGNILRRQGYRPAAMLAYLAFLQREFNTERSYSAAVALINSMHAPKADDKAPTVTVHVDDDLTQGFIGLQMAYYTAKIRRSDDDEFIAPLSENVANALHIFLRKASTVKFEDGEGSYVAKYLLPKSVRITEAGSAESFAWFVVGKARIPGAHEWLISHPTEVDQLVGLFEISNHSTP